MTPMPIVASNSFPVTPPTDPQRSVLYVGSGGQSYLDFFLPNFFAGPIDHIDWMSQRTFHSLRSIKEEVFRRVQAGKHSAIALAATHDPFFYFDEIEELTRSVPVIGIFGDDTNMPQYASEIACCFDHVLTTDPLQIDRYAALNIPASLHLFDTCEEKFPLLELTRDIDVLLYGVAEKGRSADISWLKCALEGLVIHDVTNQRVSDDELVSLLNRSRITINWNHVWQRKLINNYSDPLFSRYSQMKGRVFEAALCGCLPLSTPNEAQRRILGPSLPVFRDRTELRELITSFLADEESRCLGANLLRQQVLGYLRSFSEVPLVPRRELDLSFDGRLIDQVSSTHKAIYLLYRLRLGEWGLFIRDLGSVRWTVVKWRFVIREAMLPISRVMSRFKRRK